MLLRPLLLLSLLLFLLLSGRNLLLQLDFPRLQPLDGGGGVGDEGLVLGLVAVVRLSRLENKQYI